MQSYKCMFIRIKERHLKQQALHNRIYEYHLELAIEKIQNPQRACFKINNPISFTYYSKIFQMKDRLSRRNCLNS